MKHKRGRISIILGLLLIAAALCLCVYNVWDAHRAARTAVRAVEVLEEQLAAAEEAGPDGAETPHDTTEPLPDYRFSPYMEMPVRTVDGVSYIGVLEIPVLGLELPVISRWSYPDLKIAPCRYSGSAYLDDLILCAHNYDSHFGNLKTLLPGDGLTFTDMDGNMFYYEVTALETLMPNATEEIQSGGWDLTLFTCTLGGRTRVVVRCDRLEKTVPAISMS